MFWPAGPVGRKTRVNFQSRVNLVLRKFSCFQSQKFQKQKKCKQSVIPAEMLTHFKNHLKKVAKRVMLAVTKVKGEGGFLA